MKKKRFDFNKGLGSELLCTAIMLLGVVVMIAILVTYSRYNASIKSQIIADVIVDGSVAYAQNNMDVAEEPYKQMAEVIYNRNKEIQDAKGLCILTGVTIAPPARATERQDLFTDAEKKYINQRGQMRVGVLHTTWFNFFNTGRFDGIENVAGQAPAKTYTVRYAGPKYMDEICTVSVTANVNIPFISDFTKTSSTASVFTMAAVPYNSRAGKSIFSEPSLRQYKTELENIAYSGVGMTSEDIKLSKDIPEFGSIQQKVILEARRYLGDGYDIAATEGAWPKIDESGMPDTEFSTNAKNSYKNCYAFVNSCFNFDHLGGLDAALARYEHTYMSRDANFVNLVSAKTIWEEMHSEGGTPVRHAYRSKNTGKWYYNRALDPQPKFWDTITWNPNGSWQVGNTVWYINSKGDKLKKPIPAGQKVTFNRNNHTFTIGKKALTLGEAIGKYCGENKTPIWALTGVNINWTLADLRVGDVLIFEDANWTPRVTDMLIDLAGMDTPDDAVFQKYDDANQSFISHYALYIGNGRMVHASNLRSYSSTPANQGVYCLDIDSLQINSSSTSVVTGILRFDEDGYLAPVDLEIPAY